MKLLIFLAAIFFSITGLIFISIQRNPITNSPVQLLEIEGCTAQPCLFGTPIGESSRNEVEAMIGASALTGDVTFHSGRRLNWRWSAEGAEQLNLDKKSEANWSYVALNERYAEEVRLSLNMQLGELLILYGLPDRAIPYMATQRGELHYLLTFQGVQGFFEVALHCLMTKLSPDTPVVSYISKNIPNIERLAVVNWHVYTTTLPNCSIFR